MFKNVIHLWVSFSVFAGMTGAARADTLYVPGGYATIQAAINAAAAGDTVLLANGAYVGVGNRDITFLGKAITVKSQFGPTNCVINCQSLGRGFLFQSGETPDSVLEGVTIINGLIDVFPDWGGAVYCDYSSPTIRNCAFRNNEAGDGGAIASYHGHPYVYDCQILDNHANFNGGGFRSLEGGGTFEDCVFEGNTADDAYGGGGAVSTSTGADEYTEITRCVIRDNEAYAGGGGIYGIFASMTVTDCVIENNRARYGAGGGVSFGWSSVVRDSVIRGNSSINWGGGVDLVGGARLVNSLVMGNVSGSGGGVYGRASENSRIINCTISSNQSTYGGGGVYLSDADTWMINNRIMGNVAGGRGGAVAIGGESKPRLVNCTVVGNRSDEAVGGIRIYTPNRVPRIHNTILWDNGPGESSQIQVEAGAVNISYSCVQGWTGALGGDGNIGDDPFLVDPNGADDVMGTEDDDVHISPGSPCIDAGSNAQVFGDLTDLDGDGDLDEKVPLDFDLEPRFVDDPTMPDSGNGSAPIVDMGIYEYQAEGGGCTDQEQLKASCSDATGFNVVTAKLVKGAPGTTVTFYLDGARPRSRTVNAKGKAKAAWGQSGGVDSGPHETLVQLACDVTLEKTTTCP